MYFIQFFMVVVVWIVSRSEESPGGLEALHKVPHRLGSKSVSEMFCVCITLQLQQSSSDSAEVIGDLFCYPL